MRKLMNSKKRFIALVLAMVLLAAIPLMTASAVVEEEEACIYVIDEIFGPTSVYCSLVLYKCIICGGASLVGEGIHDLTTHHNTYGPRGVCYLVWKTCKNCSYSTTPTISHTNLCVCF